MNESVRHHPLNRKKEKDSNIKWCRLIKADNKRQGFDKVRKNIPTHPEGAFLLSVLPTFQMSTSLTSESFRCEHRSHPERAL